MALIITSKTWEKIKGVWMISQLCRPLHRCTTNEQLKTEVAEVPPVDCGFSHKLLFFNIFSHDLNRFLESKNHSECTVFGCRIGFYTLRTIQVLLGCNLSCIPHKNEVYRILNPSMLCLHEIDISNRNWRLFAKKVIFFEVFQTNFHLFLQLFWTENKTASCCATHLWSLVQKWKPIFKITCVFHYDNGNKLLLIWQLQICLGGLLALHVKQIPRPVQSYRQQTQSG